MMILRRWEYFCYADILLGSIVNEQNMHPSDEELMGKQKLPPKSDGKLLFTASVREGNHYNGVH